MLGISRASGVLVHGPTFCLPHSPAPSHVGIGVKQLMLLVAVLLLGCSHKPKAPALSNDPVYHNAHEGFRFLVPTGWVQAVKADLPAGRLDAEHLLVRYTGVSGDAPGTLEVSCADIPESTNLAEYLAGPSHSIKGWKAVGQPEEAKIQNVPATRFVYHAGEVAKDVVAVRRGERVYFFSALHSAKDTQSRDQLRQAVSSLVWER
jgi:hypothetical protein